MDYLAAIVLGIVQGITEFLPISSSGHLLIVHEFLNFATDQSLAFDIALHIGTLITIVVYFTPTIVQYAKTSPKLLGIAALSSIPAGIVGLLFNDVIDEVLRSPWVVVAMLVIVAIVFILVERLAKPVRAVTNMQWWQALLIGCAQALALVPGTSRSGITMSMAMSLGFKRDEAAQFSFIMVIPLLVGLTGKEMLDMLEAPPSSHELGLMVVGAITAAVVGLFAVKFLMGFFKRSTLVPFAWYRLALAAVVSLLLLL